MERHFDLHMIPAALKAVSPDQSTLRQLIRQAEASAPSSGTSHVLVRYCTPKRLAMLMSTLKRMPHCPAKKHLRGRIVMGKTDSGEMYAIGASAIPDAHFGHLHSLTKQKAMSQRC